MIWYGLAGSTRACHPSQFVVVRVGSFFYRRWIVYFTTTFSRKKSESRDRASGFFVGALRCARRFLTLSFPHFPHFFSVAGYTANLPGWSELSGHFAGMFGLIKLNSQSPMARAFLSRTKAIILALHTLHPVRSRCREPLLGGRPPTCLELLRLNSDRKKLQIGVLEHTINGESTHGGSVLFAPIMARLHLRIP